MADYPFDTDQLPKGPMDTLVVKWPLGTRYLVEEVIKCTSYQHCGVERAGLVATKTERDGGYWYTLCPEHYAQANHLPDWPDP